MQNQLGTSDALDFDVAAVDFGDKNGDRSKPKNFKRINKVRRVRRLGARLIGKLCQDKKFGFGGGKRNSRRNTGESVGETKGYSGRQNKKPFPGTQVRTLLLGCSLS